MRGRGLTPTLQGTDFLFLPASQLKKLDLAAAAAHTFFVANPTHLQMREDMAKYRRMSRVRQQSFRDLETPPHWVRPSAGPLPLPQPLANRIHRTSWTVALCTVGIRRSGYCPQRPWVGSPSLGLGFLPEDC